MGSPFIVGTSTAKVGYRALSSFLVRIFHTLAADLVRLIMGAVNAQRAWQEMGGHVDWVYERSCTSISRLDF